MFSGTKSLLFQERTWLEQSHSSYSPICYADNFNPCYAILVMVTNCGVPRILILAPKMIQIPECLIYSWTM